VQLQLAQVAGKPATRARDAQSRGRVAHYFRVLG
jgi:hypothetical protein